MEFRPLQPDDSSAVENLFVSAFSRSADEREGALIGKLVTELMASAEDRDVRGFVAVDEGHVLGAIFFSRLTFTVDTDVFILSPVAVHNAYQSRGIGQALVTHGLRQMKNSGVRIVITYGDPAFYAKVGFRPLSQDVIQAPLELSQPEGWLGQSLTDDPIEPIAGPCSCVQALDNPVYW